MAADQLDVVVEAEAIVEDAAKDAYMPAHSWGYGPLAQLIDRTRTHGTPPEMKHCDCIGHRLGFEHVPAVSR